MIRYITSPAQGNGSGDSWANGALLQSKLGTFFAASDPGDEIWIEGGKTHILNGATLTSTRLAGATELSRVRIRGVNPLDGTPLKATIEGTQRTDPWVTGGSQGARCLKLEGGTRFIHLSDLIFRRHAEAIQFRHPDNTGFLVEDCDFVNVSSAISQATLCPSLTDSTFRRLTVRGHTGNVAGFNGDSHDLLLEDIDSDAEYQDDGIAGKGSNGASLGGTAHDITFRRCNFRNGGREEGTNYWNGDGFVTDNLNHRLTYDDCKASGWLDAGWDMKSSETVLLDCESSDNKRNYRFHSANDFILERCRSLSPHKRGGSGSQDHFQLEHNSTQPFPSTDVQVFDSFVYDDDPATNLYTTSGSPTSITFTRGRTVSA